MRLKKLIYQIIDALLISTALIAAFLIRFGLGVPIYYVYYSLFILPYVIVLKITVFYAFGLYRQLWRYASLKESIRLLVGISMASLTLSGGLFLAYMTDIPRGILIIDWLLTLWLVGGSRFIIRAREDVFRFTKTKGKDASTGQKRVIIVGAGEAGSMLVKHMQREPEWGYKPIAFLDDNPLKKDLMVHGIRVVGNTRLIPSIFASYPADEVILAIPSASRQKRKSIALDCKELGIPCKTVPDISVLEEDETRIAQITDIDIKGLLRRKEVAIDLANAIDCYKDKTVLITGAAGSIGNELCRQAIALKPKRVIAADISENGLYHLGEEMVSWLHDSRDDFETHILDVRNGLAVDRLFEKYKPDVVFHTAAYKHVPMMEKHPIEAMENNFLGTRIMIEAANRYGTERFVFISTDKAVNPTSIMGLSKQFCEKAIKVTASEKGNTKFMAVRFGNVLGSNGSVISKFKHQISNKEPVTVTHPDITRYFMTIHEAVHLVIQASAMGNGGELFILDMGEPIKIIDLAKSMIRLYGYEPEKDIPIIITGLRPGEKLYEELASEDEVIIKTSHCQILQVFNNLNKENDVAALEELVTLIKERDIVNLYSHLHQNRTVKPDNLRPNKLAPTLSYSNITNTK